MRVIEVVAGVIFDRKRILACQRPAGKALAGFWEFPGGKVEAGETLAQALERELAEELALKVMVLDEMYYLELKQPDKLLRLHFLRAFLQAGSAPESREDQQFRWLAPKELKSVEWLTSDQEFVNFLEKI